MSDPKKATTRRRAAPLSKSPPDYDSVVAGMVDLLEQARRASVRAVNALMTASYWEIGRRIVEFEQAGEKRAGYGEELIPRLAQDLTARFGRGFGQRNIEGMRKFYLAFPSSWIRASLAGSGALEIPQTLSAEFEPATGKAQTPSAQSSAEIRRALGDISESPSRKSFSLVFGLRDISRAFPLPWSHYVLLIGRSRSPEAMAFYHAEALRGGWSVRQLQRQIGTQFYERTALSKNKAAMLTKGAKPQPEDAVSADEEIRSPLVLEFLNLKDEYSESDLEEALIRHLETFLLELGSDFAFVGRQRRLRIDDTWYRVDLVFFHRVLRCLVVLDLKLDKLTPGDIGQMHVYCNYAKAHWTHPGENPPVGIILCAAQGDALVRYATEGLPNKTLVREYLTALPDEQLLADEIAKTRRMLEARK